MRRALLVAALAVLAASTLADDRPRLAVSAPARAAGRVPVRVEGEGGELEVRFQAAPDFVPATLEKCAVPGLLVWNARVDLRARHLVRSDAVLRVRRGGETATSEPVSVDLSRWERFAGVERSPQLEGSWPALEAPLLSPGQLARDGDRLLVADPFAMRVRSLAGGRIEALAGNGFQRHGAREGDRAPETALDFPRGVAVDANHVVFIADPPSHEVLAVDPSGAVSVVASRGLVLPRALVSLEPGVLLVAEDAVSRIQRLRYVVEGARVRGVGLTVLVGAESGPPQPGFADGACGHGGPARVRGPQALCRGAGGAVLVADTQNHAVRRLVGPAAGDASEWRLETVAGAGRPGFAGDGGPAKEALLAAPLDVAVDAPTCRTFVADAGNQRVRAIGVDGKIATLLGDGAVTLPDGLCCDGEGALYVADAGTRVVLAVRDGKVTRVAGRSASDDPIRDGSESGAAAFEFPHVGALRGRSLYLSEITNVVRRIDLVTGEVFRIAGDGVLASRGDGAAATSASVAQPVGLAVSADGEVFVCERAGHRVRRIDREGVIHAFAGTGRPGSTGDGGPALEASLDGPHGICVSSSGAVYVSEFSGHRIRRVARDGTISTVCGTGNPLGPRPDGVAASATSIQRVVALAVGEGETIYYAESGAHLVRRFEPGGAVQTVAGVPFTPGFDGDGSARGARLDNPTGVAVDRDGAVYIADTGNHRLRKVAAGTITTIAGSGEVGVGPFGGEPARAANAFLGEMVLDESGDLFVTDILAGQVVRVAVR